MKETLAIVVTYNRRELLKECLEALKNQSEHCDVLVIDNHSTDDTSIMVKEYLSFDWFRYIDTGVNLGGAGGYNFGLKEGCEYDYKYFWLMDDDTIPEKDALLKFEETAKKLKDRFGFLSSKVLWKDGSICKTNVQRKKVARMIKDFKSPLVKVDYASFVSLFIKKYDVVKLGLPIKDFFIWSDDLEYTRRFTLEGGRKQIILNGGQQKPYDLIPCGRQGYLVNESIVVHKCKENIGIDITKDSPDRIDRYIYIYRNDVYTFKREGILGWGFLFARYVYHTFKILFNAQNKWKKFCIMTKGYIDGLTFNPEIEYVNSATSIDS